jgi:hypothetical protein
VGRDLFRPDQHNPAMSAATLIPTSTQNANAVPDVNACALKARPVKLEQVVVAAQEYGRTDGDADRATDLLRRVDESRSEPASS